MLDPKRQSHSQMRIIHAEISEGIDLFNNNSSQKLSQESSPAKARDNIGDYEE